MRALVTGGSGFLGSYIVEELTRRKYDVHFIDVKTPSYAFYGVKFNKMNILNLDGFISANNFDVVFHCAGLLGTETLFNRIKEAATVNIIGTINILNWAKENKDITVVQPNLLGTWKNIYMISKHCAEDIGLMFDKYLHLKYLSIRPSDVYGPRQSTDELKAAPVFVEQAYFNQDLTVYGDGSSWVNYVYAEDVAKFLIDAYVSGAHGEIIDFCKPDSDMTSLNFAKEIIRLSNSSSGIKHLPMRKGQPGNIKHIDYDLSRAFEITDMTKLVPLEKGLTEMISWYRGKVMD